MHATVVFIVHHQLRSFGAFAVLAHYGTVVLSPVTVICAAVEVLVELPPVIGSWMLYQRSCCHQERLYAVTARAVGWLIFPYSQFCVHLFPLKYCFFNVDLPITVFQI